MGVVTGEAEEGAGGGAEGGREEQGGQWRATVLSVSQFVGLTPKAESSDPAQHAKGRTGDCPRAP